MSQSPSGFCPSKLSYPKLTIFLRRDANPAGRRHRDGRVIFEMTIAGNLDRFDRVPLTSQHATIIRTLAHHHDPTIAAFALAGFRTKIAFAESQDHHFVVQIAQGNGTLKA